MNEDKIKQVIVMRKDLNMRKGKIASQASHSSIAFLTRQIQKNILDFKEKDENLYNKISIFPQKIEIEISPDIAQWIESGFTKICVVVNSEEELLEIYQKALDANLGVDLITDSGLTEFHGVPTKTCLAIHPTKSSIVDKITGHLTLY